MAQAEKTKVTVRVSPQLKDDIEAAIRGFCFFSSFAEKALKVGLYLIGNLDLRETFQLVENARPLALLKAARNDLSHKGFDVSKLDEVIESVEAFLQESGLKGMSQNDRQR